MKRFWHRLLFAVKSRIPRKQVAWLKEAEAHVDTLEQQLNNVAVSLSKFRAHEASIRTDLEALLVKIEKISEKIEEDPGMEASRRNHLSDLQRQYQSEALDLGKKLEGIEQRRADTQSAHQELRAAIQQVSGRLEAAKARYYSAEARQTLYGDASGIANADGMSKLDRLFNRVKSMEAEAEAAYELSPLEMQIDAQKGQ